MADSQKKLIILPDNPLCGISTYKDTLNLANGVCTRYVKKLVLTGNESGWVMSGTGLFYNLYLSDNPRERDAVMSTHFAMTHEGTLPVGTFRFGGLIESPSNPLVFNYDNGAIGLEAFKSWLASQYANGTPVTVWFIPTTATTETIDVPSGLSGTEEGYLNQSGTPTPTNPIYPTANNVEIWLHSLRKLTTATWTGWHDASVKEKSENLFDKDNDIVNYYLASTNGAYQATSGMSRSIKLKISPSSVYSITLTSYTKRIGFFENEPTDNDVPVAFYNNDTNEYSQSSFTITSPESANYMVIFCYNSSKEYPDGKTINEVMSSVMVNIGSTALPYEPYWK